MNKCFIFVFLFIIVLNSAKSAQNLEIFVEYTPVPLKQVSFSIGLYGRYPGSVKDELITDHRVTITNSVATCRSHPIVLPLLCGEKLEKRALQTGISTIACTSNSRLQFQQFWFTKIMGGASMISGKDKKTYSGVMEQPFSNSIRISCSPTSISILPPLPPPGQVVRRHTDSELL